MQVSTSPAANLAPSADIKSEKLDLQKEKLDKNLIEPATRVSISDEAKLKLKEDNGGGEEPPKYGKDDNGGGEEPPKAKAYNGGGEEPPK